VAIAEEKEKENRAAAAGKPKQLYVERVRVCRKGRQAIDLKLASEDTSLTTPPYTLILY
jgi:hypothetical protein